MWPSTWLYHTPRRVSLLHLISNKIIYNHVGGLVFLHFWTSGGPVIMYTKFDWVWYKDLDFHYFAPPPLHFGRLVFTFFDFWKPTDCVYKIWLSLLTWPRFLFFDPPPLILAHEKKNIFVIIGSFYSIFHFSCYFSLKK